MLQDNGKNLNSAGMFRLDRTIQISMKRKQNSCKQKFQDIYGINDESVWKYKTIPTEKQELEIEIFARAPEGEYSLTGFTDDALNYFEERAIVWSEDERWLGEEESTEA